MSVENTQSQESRVDEKDFNIDIQNTPEEESQVADIYRLILSQYLLETLELETYDQELLNSEMRYIPNKGDDIMHVQERDKMNLIYLYLRNDLHVERLTDEDIAILLEESANENVYSDRAKKVVLKTFVNVIAYKEIKSDADKKIQTTYDSTAEEDLNGKLGEVPIRVLFEK